MAKSQLNEMKSLINRMENPQSGWATLLQEGVIEEYKDPTGLGRRDFEDVGIVEFLKSVRPNKGQFIGIGYIQNYEVKGVYPEKPTNGTTTKDAFTKYQQGLSPDNRLYGKIGDMLSHDQMTNPSGTATHFKSIGQSFRKMKEGNPFVSVLKVTSYNFPFTSYSKAIEDKNTKFGDLRVKGYGFGQPVDFYDQDDWRNNPEFGGVGRLPAFSPKKNPDGSDYVYHYSVPKYPDFNVYYDNDEYGNPVDDKNGENPQNMAMRALIPMGNGKPIYCAIDANGEIDDIDTNIYHILRGVQSSFAKAKITDEMAEDEKRYRQDVADFENKYYNPQWLLNNIAYIVGKGKDVNTGEEIPYRFVNRNIILSYAVDNINVKELNRVIENCAEKAYSDVIKATNNDYKQAQE